MKKATAVRIVILGLALMAGSDVTGQFVSNGSSALSLTVSAESAIRLGTPGTTLARISGEAFDGETNLRYRVRTLTMGGSGNITVKITSDFPAGHSPAPTFLGFTCGASGPGSGCVGSQSVGTARDVTVVRFGAGAHSGFGGDSGQVSWTLAKKPDCGDDICNAIATFTISSN